MQRRVKVWRFPVFQVKHPPRIAFAYHVSQLVGEPDRDDLDKLGLFPSVSLRIDSIPDPIPMARPFQR